MNVISRFDSTDHCFKQMFVDDDVLFLLEMGE